MNEESRTAAAHGASDEVKLAVLATDVVAQDIPVTIQGYEAICDRAFDYQYSGTAEQQRARYFDHRDCARLGFCRK